jgi:hypothetical protein
MRDLAITSFIVVESFRKVLLTSGNVGVLCSLDAWCTVHLSNTVRQTVTDLTEFVGCQACFCVI